MNAQTGFISPLACIGEPPEHREHRWKYLRKEEEYFQPVISPTAIIEAFATIDGGIIEPTYIGDRVLVMKHAHIGHDATIASGSNIAPGAIIGGHCLIGHEVKIGLGASIRPRVVVGDRAVIGAGAVVVKDVPAGEVWVGNPARQLTGKKEAWYPDEDAWMEWFDSWHPRG